MNSRRQFLQKLGASSAVLPFLGGLPGLRAASSAPAKRLIIMFTPNGTILPEFWPDQEGENFETKRILKPLDPWKQQMTLLKGIHNKVGGDGDRHMRGMSCLLTGTELFPGNIQGGSDTPAGWASGISIDQELKNRLQADEATRTAFGSLEFGVAVPNRADPWTRMSYAGPNQPVAPISDPRLMLKKLYGNARDQQFVASILDDVQEDLTRVSGKLGTEDRTLLQQHMDLVRQLETRLDAAEENSSLQHPAPDVDPEIELINDNTPEISRAQIDLLVSAMSNNMSRVATLQYMRSVGQARMNWLGIEKGHHGLSHEPDKNAEAQEQLTRINEWFAGELAYLVWKLTETPEPGGNGNMLDNTLIVWGNELGKGNSHTLSDIPFVLLGGKAHGVKSGRYLNLGEVPHNRLLMSLGRSMGHEMESFGTEKYCQGGTLDLG